MHFTVYLSAKLHRSFNCNFTSIYNSVIILTFFKSRVVTLRSLFIFRQQLDIIYGSLCKWKCDKEGEEEIRGGNFILLDQYS